jgi:hypothetical protein
LLTFLIESPTMPTFRDSLDRPWTIEITFLEVKKLRSELQLDVLAMFEQESNLFERLSRDTILLVDVVSVLLSDQIRAKEMDEREFARGLVGEGLQNAIDALVEALLSFSPPLKRGMLKEVWSQQQKLEKEVVRQVIETAPRIVEKATNDCNRKLERLLTSNE